MIKSLLVAAAAAVLSLSGGGVALASSVAPLPSSKIGSDCILDVALASHGHRNWANVCVALSVGVNDGNPRNDGGPRNGDHNPRGPIGHGPVRGGPIYRDCNDARSHGLRDIRRGDSRFNDSWDRNRDGIACDDGDVVVLNSDGDCTTYATARDSIRNYSNDYNRLRGVYHGDLNRASRQDRDNLNRLYSLSHRYESSGWNQTKLSNLRTVCKDTSPTVTIINEAPPAVTTVTQAAPAPSNPVPYGNSGGQVSVKPSGGAETGDGSTKIS